MPLPVTWGCRGLCVLVLVLTSCASPQASFLRAATSYETQDTVAQQLGPPHEVWQLADGQTLWSYRVPQRLWAYWRRGHANGITGGMTVEGPGLTVLPNARCTEYVLRFDREQILRAWHRQPCQGFVRGAIPNP